MNRLNLTWINLNRLKETWINHDDFWPRKSCFGIWEHVLKICSSYFWIVRALFSNKRKYCCINYVLGMYLFNSINYLFIIIFREIVIAWCSSSVFYLINPPWPGSRKVFWMSSDTRCHEISLKKKVIIRIIHICATTLGTHFSRVSRLELTLEFILKRMSLNRCRGN